MPGQFPASASSAATPSPSPSPVGEPAQGQEGVGLPAELPEDTPASPAPPPPAPPADPILDAIEAQGVDRNIFPSGEAAIAALLQAAETNEQHEPLIQYGQRYVEHAPEFEQWLREQQTASATPPSGPSGAAVPAAEPAQPPTFQWEAPDYDPRWEGTGVERDQYGRFRAPTDMPYLAPVAAKLNTYYDWYRDAGQRIVANFPEMVRQAMGFGREDLDAFRSEFNEFRTGLTQNQAQVEANAWVESHADLFFRHDAQGNVISGLDGQPVKTPAYQVALDYANTLRQQGVQGLLLRELVDVFLERDIHRGRFGQVPAEQITPPQGQVPGAGLTGSAPGGAPASNGTPAQIGQQKRGEFLRRIIDSQRQGNRGGTIPTPTTPDDSLQNPDATIDEIFQEEAQKRGVTLTR